MRSIFTLPACRIMLILFIGVFSFQDVKAQTHTPRTVAINAACGGYYEYLPINYSTTTGKYPVLIYFSGGNAAQGNGTASSMAIILNQGVPRVINENNFPRTFTVNGETTSFIVISPQFRYKPSPAEANSFIDYIINAYPRIDRERICLTGFSIGGDVAWKTPYDLASASRLAALVPVAGYNNPYSDANAQYIAAGKLPVWAIHSNADEAPVAWTIGMVNKINSYNPEVPPLLTRPDGLSHVETHQVVYEPTYKPLGLNIYEWCLQFRRASPARPPVANAGADKSITLPVNNVTLTGSATDPDGGTLSYAWTKIGGPAAFTIGSPSAASTAVTGLAAGEYQFQLQVTDPTGLTGKDTVKVTVQNAPNQLPVANAGSNVSITLPSNSVTLNASGSSDPDGNIVSYNWAKISGPAAFTISNATAANPVISGLTAGSYSIQLTVTDDKNATAKDTVVVTVNPAPNKVPAANAGNDVNITLPQNSVTLNGSASSDPDGTIVTYNWIKVSGPSSFTINNASVVNPVISNLVAGTYSIRLAVTDNSGATSTDFVSITVNAAPNQLPVANAGNDVTITLPQNSVTLNGSASSDADGNIASYSWAKISGPASFTISNANVVSPVISDLIEGTYTVQLTVTDNSGATNTDLISVTVNAAPNQLPVANAGADQSITLPVNTVTLSGTGSSDPDGSITAYQWTQVAGPSNSSLANATAATATASGLIEGTYRFELTVRDNSNATAKATVVVTVAPAPTSGEGNGSGRIIQVNIYGGSNPAGAGWNNWNVAGNLTLTNAKYADGTSSGVNVNLNISNAVADNGNNYPVTMCPVTVGRHTSYSTVMRTLVISGLDNTKQYELEVYSSRAGSGNSTKFTVGSKVINVVSSNNYANKAQFDKLTPASGQIRLIIERVNTYNYINGFTLKETGGEDEEQVNQPPVASAGADQQLQLPVNSIQLNGSGADSDGTIVSYQWSKVSGPGSGQISNTAIANPVVSGLSAGTYVLELTVTDNDGAVATDTVMITVNAIANVVPVANAGQDQSVTLPANTVSLNGSASADSDGSITAYQWKQVGGPATATLNNATTATATAAALVEGIYRFELSVRDNDNAEAKDTVMVTVNRAPNIAPVANAGTDQSVNLPANTVSLNGSGSADSDGSITGYQWKQIGGPATATLNNFTSSIASATNLVEGIYRFELTVRDNDNAEAKDTVMITVNPPLLSEKVIKVNLYGGSNPAGSEWNNWNVQSNLTYNGLKYSDGTSSSVSVSINVSNAIADNGANYPVTMCPAEVGRTTSYSTVARFVTLKGLDNTKRYEMEVYGSRNGTGNSTKFSIGTTVINVVTDHNYSNRAVFTNLAPAGGQIVLTIERLNTYNYINGFIIREIGSGQSLMTSRSATTATPEVAVTTPSPEITEEVSSKVELGTYPNPFVNTLDLQVNNDKTGVMSVVIVNQSGLPVKQLQFAKEQGTFRRSITLQDLQPGVYFLRVQMQGWRKVEKIVKMK